MEVRNRFKGLDLIECLMNYGWRFVALYRRQESRLRNGGVEEVQTGIKIIGRNINNLRYADDTTLMAESEEELKEPLDDSKRRE